MPNPKPTQTRAFTAKQFQPQGDEPLAKVRGIRLPQAVDAAIESLPANERSSWVRRVICEAVERELLAKTE